MNKIKIDNIMLSKNNLKTIAVFITLRNVEEGSLNINIDVCGIRHGHHLVNKLSVENKYKN